MAVSETVDLDGILGELGQFGKYQVINYCFILVPIVFSAIYNGQYVFNAASVRYRCTVPQCESSPPEFVAGPWRSWALPDDEAEARCYRVVAENNHTCTPDSFLNTQTERCHSWVYEDQNSIVSTFELSCEEWRRTLVGTMHAIGLLVALPLTAAISDNFGRRTALVATAVAGGVVGLVRSFSVNYVMYIVLEFAEATLGSGVYSTGFILALEMVGLKRRVLGGNIISSSYAIGQVVLALVAWAVPYWRNMTRALYAPSLLFIFYIFLIEESVRWLLSKGRKEEAARIIFKAAKTNKKKLSPRYVDQLTSATRRSSATEPNIDQQKTEEKGHSLVYQVLHSKIILFRLVVCSWWWITATFVYFGLSINSVSLGDNGYVNYILMSLVEIPGYALSVLTLDRFGRKRSIITAYFLCGASLVAIPFVPESLSWLTTALTMLGKLCISMTFSSIYIYTSELFPTSARHSLLGTCSMVGRVGSIVAPQTPLLMTYMVSLPYLLFGVMAVTSGLLMLLTPETLGRRLPDTVQEAENIIKHDGDQDCSQVTS